MKLDHFTLKPSDLEATKSFFTGVIGLEVGERPPFKFPGYWLYGGGKPIVHLVGGDEAVDAATGAIDHLAFHSTNKLALMARLTGSGYEYSERTVPASGMQQVFIEGPDGLKIEVNFPPEPAGIY